MTTYNNGLTLTEAIENAFGSDVSDSAIIDIWNQYCDDNNYTDDYIENIDSFDAYFDHYTPTQIADMISFSGECYQCNANYFTFDPCNNEVRTYYSERIAVAEKVEFSDLIDWLERSGEWENLLGDYITADEEE